MFFVTNGGGCRKGNRTHCLILFGFLPVEAQVKQWMTRTDCLSGDYSGLLLNVKVEESRGGNLINKSPWRNHINFQMVGFWIWVFIRATMRWNRRGGNVGDADLMGGNDLKWMKGVRNWWMILWDWPAGGYCHSLMSHSEIIITCKGQIDV